jgi:hypothetical protein
LRQERIGAFGKQESATDAGSSIKEVRRPSSPNNLWLGIIDASSVDSARKLDNTPPVISHTQPFTNTTATAPSDEGRIAITEQSELDKPRRYIIEKLTAE